MSAQSNILENKRSVSQSQSLSQSRSQSLSRSQSYSQDDGDKVMQDQSNSRSRSGTFSNLDSLNSYSEDTQSEQVDRDAEIKRALKQRLEQNYEQQTQIFEEPKIRTRCCRPCITKNRVYATCATLLCGSVAYVLHNFLF